MDPDAYYDACMWDFCKFGGSVEGLECNSFESYSEACGQAGNKEMNWRTTSRCGKGTSTQKLPCLLGFCMTLIGHITVFHEQLAKFFVGK